MRLFVGLIFAGCAGASAAWSQGVPGQVWFVLPGEACHAGQPYRVGLHVNVGAVEPNLIDLYVVFDNELVQVAFSGGPPGFLNPDVALGKTLVDAGITDLQVYHSESDPGIIHATRVGGKGPAWPLTGDIELLRITFHPTQEAPVATLDGLIADLKDADLLNIATAEFVPTSFEVLPAVPMPSEGPLGLGVLGLVFMLCGMQALSRRFCETR